MAPHCCGPLAFATRQRVTQGRVAALTLLLSLVVTPVLGAQPVSAAPGPCPDANGVTVVVDFGAFGGGVEVRCAPGQPASGMAALTSVGFTVEGAARSPSFLCRIDGRPGADRDRCVVPSPPNAYWAYWVADRGGSWCYSNAGMNRRPVRGTVEGWSFATGTAAAPRSSTFSPVAGAGSTGRNCDTTATTAAPPTTVAPTTPPPTTRPAGGGSSGGQAPQQDGPRGPGSQATSPGAGSVGGSASGAGGGATPDPGAAGAPGDAGATGGGHTDEQVAGATTSSAVPGTGSSGPEVDPGDDERETPDGSREDPERSEQRGRRADGTGSEEALSTIRSADSGRSGPGSPLGSGIAVGAVAALGLAAVVVNRRRFRSLAVVGGPTVDTPTDDTPTVDTPAVDTPADDTPVDGMRSGDAPGSS